MAAGKKVEPNFGVVNSCPEPQEVAELLTGKETEESEITRDLRKCGKCKRKPDKWEFKERSQEKTALFLRVRTFVACLSLLQLVQVMGSGYSKSALTSIERRYRLSTFSIGVLQSCFHIGNLSVILFVSYYGSKWHRPRAIAIGSLLMAASSLISCMPQFVGDRYNVESPNLRSGLISGKVMLVNMPSQQQETHGSTSQLATRTSNISPRHEAAVMVVSNVSAYLNSNDSSLLSGLQHIANYTDVEELLRTLHMWSKEVRVARDGEETEFVMPGGQTQFRLARSRVTELDEKQLRLQTEVSGISEKQLSVVLSNATGHQLCKPASIGKDDWAAISALREAEHVKGKNSGDDSFLYVFIAVGSVLKGMGHSPLHPLGMSFIDDYASGSNSAVYIGVVSALSLLGPAFGFILGSLTTNIWVDSGWVNTTEISVVPQDSVWVGAWWMGYLITGVLLVIATIPFCAFPRVITREQEGAGECEAPCVSCIKVYFSDNDDSEISDTPKESTADEEYEETASTGEEDLPHRNDELIRTENTSRSMDFFTTQYKNQEQDRFALYSEVLSKENERVACRLDKTTIARPTGEEQRVAPGQRRFRRSASAPAINVSNKCRTSRAFSIHHTECILNKGVWERTVGAMNNSPSTASLKGISITIVYQRKH